ncbi:MAG: ExbD/TolR family protein [Deltaproteobacteria bacterium]
MGLKKDSKVSAEFNMSSLTDIIFLLLIFFMLTSSAVIPNALNLRLPGKSNSMELETKPYIVSISGSGDYFVNQRRVSLETLESGLIKLKERSRGKTVSIIISPDSDVQNEKVVAVMDIAYRLEIDAIMTKPK